MQPIRTIWTIFVRDHPGTIPVQFGQIPISGSREDVVKPIWKLHFEKLFFDPVTYLCNQLEQFESLW